MSPPDHRGLKTALEQRLADQVRRTYANMPAHDQAKMVQELLAGVDKLTAASPTKTAIVADADMYPIVDLSKYRDGERS